MGKIKVLITGPVNGAFTDLTTKLTSLQASKAGPFDMCFCVGPFFSNAESMAAPAKDLLENGMPLPVYFCDMGILPAGISLPNCDVESVKDDAEISLDDDDNDNDGDGKKECSDDNSNDDTRQCPKGVIKAAYNLYHLYGKNTQSQTQTADILNISPPNNGNMYLTVAFIPPNARIDTVQTSTLKSKISHPSYIGCDLLLTSDWGQGMAQSACIPQQDKVKLNISMKNENEVGSFDIAEMASQCRPRYHIAPSINAGGRRENGTDESSYFIQSLQYINPPSALASGIMKNYHTSRFLALCHVVDVKTQKQNGKARKYIHALGIQPLWSMDHVTATSVAENAIVVPCPYTDESFLKDPIPSHNDRISKGVVVIDSATAAGEYGVNGSGGYGSNRNHSNVGLSEAQTRRIMSEDGAAGSQYRWNIRNNRKRPLDATQQQQQEDPQQQSAANDPSNCSLFLHGLHNDLSGGVQLNRDVIHNAFGCMHVRYPSNKGGHPSYCFLDFKSHEDAKMCLGRMGIEPVVAGVNLTLKWSSGGRRMPIGRGTGNVPPPPPPPGHVGIYAQPMQKKAKMRLTEAEAANSSSLFVHLGLETSVPATDVEGICTKGIQYVGRLAQKMLEDAINAGNAKEDCVTAEDEPALKVTARNPVGKVTNYGFLDLASHAAASMALATLTGSTDGGSLQREHHNDQDGQYEEMKKILREVQLWWAKPTCPTATSDGQGGGGSGGRFAFKSHHFPPDARTDCWFCLASPTCEKHLIVSIMDHCYITMPKGPINKHHALVVPVNHSHCASEIEGGKKTPILGAFLDSTVGAVAEVERAVSKLRKYAHEELGKDLFVFERAIPTRGGYHAHINCIPVEKGLGAKIRSTMLSLAGSYNGSASSSPTVTGAIELRELQNPEISVASILKNAEDDGLSGYFYCEVPCGDGGHEFKRFLYTAIEDGRRRRHVSLQFGREILATVLNDVKLGHWKACVVSKDIEEEHTESFRASFSKYE